MQYPLISEYILSILSSEDCFEELAYLRPVIDSDGNPVYSGGNFAAVFKMVDEKTGKYYAVKCFLRDQERRAESYRLISEELSKVDSPYLTTIRYFEDELYVKSRATADTQFPVLLMDWVDGVNLDKYVRENINDQYELSMLAYRFSQLSMWLLPQPFAHGDLKQDNILVKEDGSLVLVDYDGMYVPAMKGQLARELGSPDFRHPLRTDSTFNEHIDDFSVVSILLSLKAIAVEPSLLDQFGAPDRLLFSVNDYCNLNGSSVLRQLYTIDDSELKMLCSVFTIALQMQDISLVSPQLLNISEPAIQQAPILNTAVTEEELANAWTDEFGVKYSANKKKLLKAPQYLDHYSIKSGTLIICDSAFQHCFNLTSIIIPDSITSIGVHAFVGCKGLSSVVIPNSVTSIGVSAFQECYLTSIVIPNSVTSIGRSAFNQCIKLKSIKVSHGNPRYDSRSNCNAIIESNSNRIICGCNVTVIPESVSSIGEYAFYYCGGLTSIDIPDSVTSIGVHAFECCKNLKSVNIPNSVTSIGEYAFYYCERLTTIDIPDSVTSIGQYAFSGIKDITFIDIPDGVTCIEEGTFQWCTGLTSIAIPNSITSIGKDAFKYCSSLESLLIPNSVTSIGEGAFECCDGLSFIIIPDSVTSIGKGAFKYCNNLNSLKVSDGNPIYDSRFNCNAIIESNTDTIICGCKTTFIPNSIKTIGEKAFYGIKGLSSVDIPNSVTSIGDEAFLGCSGLSSVVIPNSVISIGVGAYGWCKGLTSIVIPDGVSTIGDETFYNCEKLTSIVIPNSITSIGKSAFERSGLTSIVIPDGVLSIGEGAFRYCKKLLSVVIQDNVKSIGDEAFCACYSLKSIKVSEGNPIYNSRCDCNAIIESHSNTIICGCNTTIIPDNVTSIGKKAFHGCSDLSSVVIPDGVTFIGEEAFWGCSGLTHIIIPNSVTFIGEEAFYGCTGLKSIDIPNSVTFIGQNAFSICSGLSSLVIPDSVTTIGENAFYACKNLKAIRVSDNNPVYDSRNNCNAIIESHSNTIICACNNTFIPNDVTSIGDSAFYGIKGLSSIFIPKSVTSIGHHAFGCTGLKSIIIPDSVKSIGYNAFDNCESLSSIYIPDSVTAFGESIFEDCYGLTIFIPPTTKTHFERLLPAYKNLLEEQDSGILEGQENGHEYVDLGLSVKWATCNVGATKPYEHGDYFAWGELYPLSGATVWQSNYKFFNGKDKECNHFDIISKYNTSSLHGIIDNKETLEVEDDVAQYRWGGKWRIPTDEEFRELLAKCTWTKTKLNGVVGYIVTSKVEGFLDKSIFIPNTGFAKGLGLIPSGTGATYGSSSLFVEDPTYADVFRINYDSKGVGIEKRINARSIRPVFS